MDAVCFFDAFLDFVDDVEDIPCRRVARVDDEAGVFHRDLGIAAGKAFEAGLAIDAGADEIDMVMNIGQAKAGNWAYVEDEVLTLSRICHEKGALLKVIIETCLLTEEEIVRACRACVEGEADFVKTSTGFSKAGADADTVRLMKETVGSSALVKASGGIRTLEDARTMIEAGADRLGCSASVEIMEEYRK